jgi:DNA-binding HxlR family transcriptional regulator
MPTIETADPGVEALVHELIGRVADKWTMLLLEVHGGARDAALHPPGRARPGDQPEMLTQTLRQMERDGLVTRTVHPVVPPRVDYALTPLGASLGAAFCGVWIWAERHLGAVGDARRRFDARQERGDAGPRQAAASRSRAARQRVRTAPRSTASSPSPGSGRTPSRRARNG